MTSNIGVLGEQEAARYFVARGGAILGRNVRYPCGELDLIVQLGGVVVFVEVKTRSSEDFGAAEAVTVRKFSRMKRAAAAWLEGEPFYREVRFDVVVYRPHSGEIEHYEGIDRGAR
ncbi:YraN family protein [Corynebacterium sp. H130]|uniref:YraN family protein n=1 Tax=Corynebacterium sp. H130 TaxID=3133444 RepID=UPI0030B3E7C5